MDPPVVTDPEDALAQPTRARLFRVLSELKRRAGTVELAERLGLHPNGVRVHLERMEEAGLVVRDRDRRSRGRPRDAWAIAPDARPGGSPPSAYGDLGRWLARAMATPSRGLEDVERTGREIGRELAPAPSAEPPLEALQATLVALGFQPHVQEPAAEERDGITLCLGNCPYRDAVRENPSVVCALHRGMTRGLLDALEPKAELVDFVPHDPDAAGCLIDLAGV